MSSLFVLEQTARQLDRTLEELPQALVDGVDQAMHEGLTTKLDAFVQHASAIEKHLERIASALERRL